MFLLDTNVVSELRKARRADVAVRRWASHVPATSLFLSVVSVLEIEVGVLLAERRDPTQGAILRRWLEDRLLPAFEGRVLPADLAVIRRCAQLHVPDRRSDRDALIAATALVHQLTVVTRNTRDYSIAGLRLLNPWEE